jgi:Protein of unknown function (DUF1631)
MAIDSNIAQNAVKLRQLIDEVIQQGTAMMDRLTVQAQQALHKSSALIQTRDLRERDAIEVAAKQLERHSAQLGSRYPQALRDEFSSVLKDEAAQAQVAAPIQFDQLELMDERQVQERVEAARGLQLAVMAVESELGEFNSLVCAVLGLQQVQADKNPIRPEVFVRALRRVLAECGVDVAISQRWGHAMGAALGQELRKLYTRLKENLLVQGVKPVGFAVVKTPQGKTPAAGSVRSGDLPAGVDRRRASQSSPEFSNQTSGSDAAGLTIHQLRRLLSGELDGATAQLAARAGIRVQAGQSGGIGPVAGARLGNSLGAAAHVLGEVHQMAQALGRQGRAAGQSQDDLSTMRAELRDSARDDGQLLGQEVVNLIIANIASDARLLPPVQQLVCNLEPSLLRLALIDPRFFSDKKHPARQLLEEVAQRSFAFESEQASGFAAYLERVGRAVKELDQAEITSAQPFSHVLGMLRQLWELEDQQQQQRQESAKQALLLAEQRNQLAAELSRSIAQRPDAVFVPDEVIAFVLGPWVQVMAQARLVKPKPGDPQIDCDALVEDLFWSVRPDLTRNNLPTLVRLIPRLLEGLRQGLRLIDYPQIATQQFLDELIALHEKCMDFSGSSASRSRATAATVPMSMPATLPRHDAPWLAPQEARNSGFMDDLGGSDEPMSPGDFDATVPASISDFAATEPMSLPMELMPAIPDSDTGIADQMQEGVWIDLMVKDQWVQVQLTWASPQGTLFLFSGVSGSTHSMTRRLLDRLYREKQLRLASTPPSSVVDQALNAVAEVAMRNSIYMDIQDETGS